MAAVVRARPISSLISTRWGPAGGLFRGSGEPAGLVFVNTVQQPIGLTYDGRPKTAIYETYCPLTHTVFAQFGDLCDVSGGRNHVRSDIQVELGFGKPT
jgi:hypothetical protein